MAVQLSTSYLRQSYQLLATLCPKTLSKEEAYNRASNIVYEWGKQKFSSIFTYMPYFKETFDDKRDGCEIGVITDPENGRFVFRGVHPDNSIPGRRWITDVEIRKNNEDFILGIKLSVTSLRSCSEDIPFSIPGFVNRIIDNIGISDIIQICGQQHHISTEKEVESFAEFLQNSKRQMPVILITPCMRTEDGIFDGYMMDANQMAIDLMGVAHVFQIEKAANDYFTELVGRQWTAFNGTVRTYYPEVSFGGSDYYQHPLLTQQSIRAREWDEAENDHICMTEIEEYVKKHVQRRRVQWEDQGIEFYLMAHQNLLSHRREEAAKTNQELIELFEEQIDQLQRRCDENLALASSYANDTDTIQEEYEKQRQVNSKLKHKIFILEQQLQKAQFSEEDNIPVVGTYDEVSDWIDEYYPDKLLLHSRAVRSLKSANYEDVILVYRCLKLLATSYYDYCTGSITYEAFMAECKAVDPGLDERGAITDTAAGMQGDTYYVLHRGIKRKLERHLAKGSNKDSRYCLRIYYFWDDQDQVIVVGDLPHHLNTSAT